MGPLSLSGIAAREEALIEMYLAGVSVWRAEDITEAFWGGQVSPSTISEQKLAKIIAEMKKKLAHLKAKQKAGCLLCLWLNCGQNNPAK